MEPPASECFVPHSPCIAFGSGGDSGSLPAYCDGACLDDGPTRTRAAVPFKPLRLLRLDQAVMVAAAAAQVIALVVYVQLFSMAINSLSLSPA